MTAHGTGHDEDVTVTVTVKRGELDAVAERLGTGDDAETIRESLHRAGNLGGLIPLLLFFDRSSSGIVLRPIGAADEVEAEIRNSLRGLPSPLAATGGPAKHVPEMAPAGQRKRAVSRQEYADIFAGQPPLDPARFRADLDEATGQEPDDPYARAHHG